MKKLVLFLLFIIMGKICPAQITFNKTYDFWEDMILTDVQPVEEGYFITGHIEGTNGFYFLFKTDLYGDTIFTKKFCPEKYLNGRDPFLLINNNEYIYLAYDINNGIYIQKFSLNGDSIWLKKVTDFGGLTEIILTADNNFLILASNAKLLIHKCDLNGNKIWESSCEMVDSNIVTAALASGIIEMPDGLIKASVYYSAMESQYGQTIFNLSDSGAYINKNEVASPYDAAALFQMMNYEQDVIAIGSNMSGRFYASRLTSSDDTVWVKHYLLNSYGGYFDDMTRDGNNNLTMAGMMGEVNSDNFDLGMISFDADGNLLWWRVYNFEGYKSVVNDISLCPDGGFAVAGYIQDLPETKGKFLKTDDLGLISGPGIPETEKNIDIHIYPNPASDVLYIESAVEIKSVSVFNGFGGTVEQWNSGRVEWWNGGTGEKFVARIPLTGLPPGLYLVRVETAGGVVAGKVVVR